MAENKTKEQLKQLNDKNLLAYYKAERSRVYSQIGYYEGKLDFLTPEQQAAKDYLTEVKRELDTRGHVETK